MRLRVCISIVLATAGLVGAHSGARAQNSVADFYRGKTITLVVTRVANQRSAAHA
jgi:hypothetical protein